MDIDCFLYPGWRPRIRAAGVRREWMDASPASFAYRCLPLGLANAHGWEIGNGVGFSAMWTGGSDVGAVTIRLDDDKAEPIDVPTSLFGLGTLTFHIAGLFRTPPGWNLWVSGPPNGAKDGIAPLSGLIETDWSPYTFTMNWRFTRSNHWVRFEANEPICFFFPVERGGVERAVPRARPIDEAPELKRQFDDWSRSRDEFQVRMREDPPVRPADTWQKLYYRGLCPAGEPGAADHQSKLRVPEFADLPDIEPPPSTRLASEQRADLKAQLSRQDWLLAVQESLRSLSPKSSVLPRYESIDPDYFLEQHYSLNQPALLSGEMVGWPALARWTIDYLCSKVGEASVEVQAVRGDGDHAKGHNVARGQTVSFAQFMQQISKPALGIETYVTSVEPPSNAASFAPLHAELGRIDKLLLHGPAQDEASLLIGSPGVSAILTQNFANILLAQIVSDNRIILLAPREGRKLSAHSQAFGRNSDGRHLARSLSDATLDDVRCFDIVLKPGDVLFIPVGWWHQAHPLNVCVTAAYANFRWPNA